MLGKVRLRRGVSFVMRRRAIHIPQSWFPQLALYFQCSWFESVHSLHGCQHHQFVCPMQFVTYDSPCIVPNVCDWRREMSKRRWVCYQTVYQAVYLTRVSSYLWTSRMPLTMRMRMHLTHVPTMLSSSNKASWSTLLLICCSFLMVRST